jgi:hypothetical protein
LSHGLSRFPKSFFRNDSEFFICGTQGKSVMARLIAAIVCALVIWQLFRLNREGDVRTSKALWIPTYWLFISASRSLSEWLHYSPGGASDQSLEGSLLDRAVLSAILALGVRTPFLDNDLVRTVFRAPQSALVSNDVCLRLISDGNADLRRIRSDRGLGGDQGRMLAAITRGYLEFTFKAEYAYDYGMPQRLAKTDHLFSTLHLERLFLGRHKFAHYRVWYRDALSGYVREMLLDQRTLSRPYLDKRNVEMIVQGHLRGNRNYTTEIHKVLTLELLHRLFLDPS